MDSMRRLPGIKAEEVIRCFTPDPLGFKDYLLGLGCFGFMAICVYGPAAFFLGGPIARLVVSTCVGALFLNWLKNDLLPLPEAVVTQQFLWLCYGHLVRRFRKLPWSVIERIEHHGPCEPGDPECVAIYLKAGLEHSFEGAAKPKGYRDYHFSIRGRGREREWSEALEGYRRGFS